MQMHSKHIVLILLICAGGAHAAAGLCKGPVTLNIGFDLSISSAQCIQDVLTTTVVNRTTAIGYPVTINQISIPSVSEVQDVANSNAANAYSTQIDGVILDTQDSFQFGTKPAGFAAFPAVATDVVLIHNLPTTQTLQLTLVQAAQIYAGNITNWNDSALKPNNPGFPFPNATIIPVVRIDYTTTTGVFTYALSNYSQTWSHDYGSFADPKISVVNKSMYSAVWPEHFVNFYGYESTGVCVTVATIPNSIGYVAEIAAIQYDSKIVKIQNDVGDYVTPTIVGITAAASLIVLNDMGIKGSENFSLASTYPLSLIEFTDFGFYTHYEDCCVAQEIMALAYMFLNCDAIAAQYNFAIGGPTEMDDYVSTNFWEKVTCGPQNINAYTSGYLASTMEPVAVQDNTAEIVGIVIGLAVILVAIAGTAIGTTVVQRNRDKEERQWNLEAGAIVLPLNNQQQQQQHQMTRPDTRSSSQTSGTTYTLGDMKFPMKPAKMLEDGRYVLLQSVGLPAAKHWKATTKAFAYSQYRHGMQMPITVAKFVGAWANQESLSTCLIYEFCAKGSLHFVLKSYGVRFEADIRYNMAYDVAEGMKYLHEKKVVHGALSSLSCFVDSNWTVKITGWMESSLNKLEKIDTFKQKQAAAKMTSGSEHVSTFEELIALLYLEPSEDVTPHQMSDVYGFGLLVVEIFSGQPPYKADIFGSNEISTLNKDFITFLRQKFLQLCAPPPNLEELASLPQVIKNMVFKCIGSFNRPTFENLALLLNEHRPVKHNIVDLMMEKMDNYVHSLEQKVEERTVELRQLLHEMLPPQIATDLLAGRSVTPEYFESISVCFLDICGFTTLSAVSSPIEILTFLNQLWSEFDNMVSKVDAYKVDTIGDAYMVCSGLPVRNGRAHVKVMCNIALSFLACAKSFRIAHRPEEQLKIRLGLNAGPAVAGVVGKTMPQYCVFGDTVNTAARMESTSEPLRIQMSENMKTLVVAYFPDDYKIAHRGEVKVKGKGMMNTYWLYGKNEVVPAVGDDVQLYRSESP